MVTVAAYLLHCFSDIDALRLVRDQAKFEKISLDSGWTWKQINGNRDNLCLQRCKAGASLTWEIWTIYHASNVEILPG
jgi:hypothetical protein